MNKYNDIRIIGLSGKAGSGKDTLADAISHMIKARLAFADPLKNICIEYFGLSRNDVYTLEGKARYNEFWGMTNREILQKVGTDALRNGFHNDVWVKIAELEILKRMEASQDGVLDECQEKSGLIVITDCRFDNEAEMIERLGGIVLRVERPSIGNGILTSGESSHKSEMGVSDDLISMVVCNDRGISNLAEEFRGKMLIFKNAHAKAADLLESYVTAGELDCEFSERILLFLKKHVHMNCEVVFPALGQGKKAIRAEWPSSANGDFAVDFAEAEDGSVEIGFKKFSTSGVVSSEGTVFGLTAENGRKLNGLV